MSEGFSIGVLAARAGVTPGTLRTWENRFGFPAGERSPSGHRRFTDADVDLVRRVLEVRDGGLPLQVAIDTVVRDREVEGERSVFAAAAAAAPGVRPLRLGRRTLVAASHAVEDECLARGDRAVHGSGNSRNGTTGNTLGTEVGDVRPDRGTLDGLDYWPGTGEDFYSAYAEVCGTVDGALLLAEHQAASRLRAKLLSEG